jgi:hypothetical protein
MNDIDAWNDLEDAERIFGEDSKEAKESFKIFKELENE